MEFGFLRCSKLVLGAAVVAGLLMWQPVVAQSADDGYYEEQVDERGLLLEFAFTPPNSYWRVCGGVKTEEFVVARAYPNEVYIEEVVLRGKDGSPSRWEVMSLPYWLRKRLPEFFNMGNRLEVSYRICGSGGNPKFVRARLVCRSQPDGRCRPVGRVSTPPRRGGTQVMPRPANRAGVPLGGSGSGASGRSSSGVVPK